jgi:hypothetical protein
MKWTSNINYTLGWLYVFGVVRAAKPPASNSHAAIKQGSRQSGAKEACRRHEGYGLCCGLGLASVGYVPPRSLSGMQ